MFRATLALSALMGTSLAEVSPLFDNESPLFPQVGQLLQLAAEEGKPEEL